MVAQSQARLSPDEYLAIERQAETKSEYLGGEMFAMSRVSPPHALIVANVCSELRRLCPHSPSIGFGGEGWGEGAFACHAGGILGQPHALIVANVCSELRRLLADRPCFVFSTDLRLRVEKTDLYCYPDAMVVCEAPRFADDERDTLLNPSLIVEVLSPSTEDWDRGGKFAHYRTIESVTDYLLVRQDSFHVELFHRAPEGRHWIFTEVEGADATVELASVGVRLALGQIYHKVKELGWKGAGCQGSARESVLEDTGREWRV